MNESEVYFNLDLLNDSDANSFVITAKDYNTQKGVVSRLNRNKIED